MIAEHSRRCQPGSMNFCLFANPLRMDSFRELEDAFYVCFYATCPMCVSHIGIGLDTLDTVISWAFLPRWAGYNHYQLVIAKGSAYSLLF